jgi:cytoskeletal protein CcmA (bactofilin family)
MSNQPLVQSKSERGIALIVVLLLMAVLSGLATGFAMNGQVESQMGQNEVYFAGARAAAEAGLNRAIVEILADTTHNLLCGADGACADSPTDAVNADNGNIAFLIGSAGPYALDAAGQYTYTIEVLDDDNNALYETPLTGPGAGTQLDAMGENGIVNNNANDRLILRATGYGPNGTTVKIARVLETVDTLHTTTTTTTTLSNPAFLVNGDLTASGNIHIQGTSGSMHANGNLAITGNSADVSNDATASGTFTANQNWHAGGSQGGGRPTINVPDIHASDYISLADFKLTNDGHIQTLQGGTWTNCTTGACTTTGFTFSGGTWSISGNSAGTGTYYVDGNVSVTGNPNGGGSGNNATNLALSIISTGSISITGHAKFTPENSQKIQFVSDKDMTIGGSVDLDDTTVVEGQIMVREQISIPGNPEFQGRVIVQNCGNVPSCTASSSSVTSNSISGNPTITYNGTLGAISTTITTTSGAPTTYVNNVSGWMEQ